MILEQIFMNFDVFLSKFDVFFVKFNDFWFNFDEIYDFSQFLMKLFK